MKSNPALRTTSQTSTPNTLTDQLGRTVNYLRLSVTDHCNFHCQYCEQSFPKIPFIPHQDILSYEEIIQIVTATVDLGIQKVRLTGGEPLLRKNILYLLEQLRYKFPTLDIRITSNASILGKYIPQLRALNINGINISLDTFQQDKFARLTGTDTLLTVLKNIEAALAAGLNIKINAVALKGINDNELPDFLHFAQRNPVTVRFIELMPMGGTLTKELWTAEEILTKARNYVDLQPLYENIATNGPAQLYTIADGIGKFGIISAVSQHFCHNCNRLRITADGRLRTCLFSNKEYRLRPLLRHAKLGEKALKTVLRKANENKPIGNVLLQQKTDTTSISIRRMSALGG